MTMQQDTGGDPMCKYSSQPFTIEGLDESGSNEVLFSFQNNWPAAMADIELFYDRGDGSGKQCQCLNSLSYGAMYPNTLAAACDPVTQTAEIEVYIRDASISNTLAASQCGDSGIGACSFVYEIPCSADVLCDDNGARRLDTPDVHANNSAAAIEPSNKSPEADTPYCVQEDFPCEGDDKNLMVHVCYYSSRIGYQTICIPESDSDILRFNENHHCGPCEGWNGI